VEVAMVAWRASATPMGIEQMPSPTHVVLWSTYAPAELKTASRSGAELGRMRASSSSTDSSASTLGSHV